MSFYVGMIISDDCPDSSLEQLREVYGISLEEVSNVSGISQKIVSLEDLDNDIIYEMEDEWIYYFD